MSSNFYLKRKSFRWNSSVLRDTNQKRARASENGFNMCLFKSNDL